MMRLIWFSVSTWCQIFNIILSTSLKTKKHCLLIILFKYINKINNRVVFEIKGGYNIQLQIHETMKILGRTQKINKQNKEW